jgi:hypothetical protein
MSKIKQGLGKLFSDNSDCTAVFYNGKKLTKKAAMTKKKFIEVVGNLLTEQEANKANKNPLI